jgi:hypothetical protein
MQYPPIELNSRNNTFDSPIFNIKKIYKVDLSLKLKRSGHFLKLKGQNSNVLKIRNHQ